MMQKGKLDFTTAVVENQTISSVAPAVHSLIPEGIHSLLMNDASCQAHEEAMKARNAEKNDVGVIASSRLRSLASCVNSALNSRLDGTVPATSSPSPQQT